MDWDNNMNDDIEQLDPFMGLYVHEKVKNPEAKFALRAFREGDVKFVDNLIKLHKDLACNDTVKMDKDWQLIKDAFGYFAKRWPEEFVEFKQSINLIRQTRNNKAKSMSGEIMYVGALPLRFERIIKIMFPAQQVDKKFIWKLVQKMPVFKVTGIQN